MKKLILFLLIGALLVLPLSGCFADNKQNEGTTPNNTTENTTPEGTTPEVTTPEVTTPEKIELNKAPDTPIPTGELDKSGNLMVEILAYLEQYGTQYDLRHISFSMKVNGIKKGAEPIHVAFDPTNYYFACGYYNVTHEYGEYVYCCAPEYTWVGYENETEIQEYYNGLKCVVVFQVNKALTVTNLLDTDTTLNMEHFQMYQPTFENGANISGSIVFDETFIYLDKFSALGITESSFSEGMMYHSVEWYYHESYSMPCICLDGEWYIPIWIDTLKTGETFNAQQALSREQITNELGEYYDAIIGVMDTEKYSVEVNEKYTYRYGVVSIDDFVGYIIK